MSEHVTRRPPVVEGMGTLGTWWDRYAGSLAASSLSPTSRDVVEADSRCIEQRGVFGAGPAASDEWPSGRVRRGIVMGAVQSGKTASMLGVAALSLDAGVDLVIVLAGTRTALWRQTYERLLDQLDGYTEESSFERSQQRVLVPDPRLLLDDDDALTPAQLYAISRARARRAVDGRTPIIAIVMKNVHHLRAMATVIRDNLVPAVEAAARPFHLLVLDDEADDGSILDARVERTLDPARDDLKQIPRAIVDLWERRPHAGTTVSPHVFATYIGYTATPQANFLQSDHNPLAPRDFALALRTPFDRGELEPRSTTFREPRGLGSFYVGGEAYYGRLRKSGISVPTTGVPAADLADAVRAFLVAGAIRLWRDPERLMPSQARALHFDSRFEASEHSPQPHSMLFHPSAAISDQFHAAAAVLEVFGIDHESAVEEIAQGARGLPAYAVEHTMSANEAAWARWLDDFQVSSVAIQATFDVSRPARLPVASDWPAIRTLLLDEVVTSTQIRVVNSDPRADERPRFGPVQSPSGSWRSPPDLSTIFVSGNVMSRGLTLEGLTTTLFLRESDDPFADTQMQMQRWFGYRGNYLELCRVFLQPRQLDLFRAYHDADEALRRTVIKEMNDATSGTQRPFVLGGPDFSATGKLTNLSNVPLCPGASPFVRLVNSGSRTDPNVELIARRFRSAPSEDVVVRDLVRGRILCEPLDLAAAAELLDELRYERYKPSSSSWEGRRWSDVETKIRIDQANDVDGLVPFFRPPEAPPEESTAYSRGGPYAISAYLRLWKACLTRHARGLVPTDDQRTPWSMVDLRTKSIQQPRFYVGIRYGSGMPIQEGPLSELPFVVHPMRRTVVAGELEAAWGSRNPVPERGHYLGDELFDYHYHGGLPPAAQPGEPMWRPVGAPGLILFHVVEQSGQSFPTVAVGVALPLGGPDQFAARIR